MTLDNNYIRRTLTSSRSKIRRFTANLFGKLPKIDKKTRKQILIGVAANVVFQTLIFFLKKIAGLLLALIVSAILWNQGDMPTIPTPKKPSDGVTIVAALNNRRLEVGGLSPRQHAAHAHSIGFHLKMEA